MNKKIAFHPAKKYIIGGILFGLDLQMSTEEISKRLQHIFDLTKEQADKFIDIVAQYESDFRNPKSVYPASAPEAVIYWYLHKYVDKNTRINRLTLKGADGFVGRYDVDCEYIGRKWIIEFDSFSGHVSEKNIRLDIAKNLLAIENGYTVIRIRNMDIVKGEIIKLDDLPYCINLHGYFIYTKERVGKDDFCLHEMLLTITGQKFDFDYDDDLTIIACMPYYKWQS